MLDNGHSVSRRPLGITIVPMIRSHYYTIPVRAFRSRTKGCNIIQQCWIQICCTMLTLVANWILHLETTLFQHCWIKFVERVWPPRWMTVNVVQLFKSMFVARACVQHCCTCRKTKKCQMMLDRKFTTRLHFPYFNIIHHHPTLFYMLAKHMKILNSTMLHVVDWKCSIGFVRCLMNFTAVKNVCLCSFLAACNICCERKLN